MGNRCRICNEYLLMDGEMCQPCYLNREDIPIDYIHRKQVSGLIVKLKDNIKRVMLYPKSRSRMRKIDGYRAAIKYLKKLLEEPK